MFPQRHLRHKERYYQRREEQCEKATSYYASEEKQKGRLASLRFALKQRGSRLGLRESTLVDALIAAALLRLQERELEHLTLAQHLKLRQMKLDFGSLERSTNFSSASLHAEERIKR